eukprot:gene6616-biopygen4423
MVDDAMWSGRCNVARLTVLAAASVWHPRISPPAVVAGKAAPQFLKGGDGDVACNGACSGGSPFATRAGAPHVMHPNHGELRLRSAQRPSGPSALPCARTVPPEGYGGDPAETYVAYATKGMHYAQSGLPPLDGGGITNGKGRNEDAHQPCGVWCGYDGQVTSTRDIRLKRRAPQTHHALGRLRVPTTLPPPPPIFGMCDRPCSNRAKRSEASPASPAAPPSNTSAGSCTRAGRY